MWKKILLWCIAIIVLVAVIVVGSYWTVSHNAEGRNFDSVEQVPYNKYGLLLATSPVTRAGAPNCHFQHRIQATDELFKSGKIEYLIASGGNYKGKEEFGCDEPAAIRDSLVARGWPEERIILDYEGTRTLNSIVKARTVYDIDSVTLISQKFHNERAIYLADRYGLHTVAYNAKPSPFLMSRIKNNLREYMARPKMFIDIIVGTEADISDYHGK